MHSFLALTGMAVVLFASTNIDDLFVLVGFFADPKLQARDIVLGQYSGIMALLCVSLGASLLSLKIPRTWVGLLGVLPILIGGKKLFDLYRKRQRIGGNAGRFSDAGRNGRVTTVAMVTMANGGDNIAIYTPLFAIRSAYEMALIALVFVVMIALWCFTAQAVVNHPRLGLPIRRYGSLLSPVVLIGLGALILYEAGSFELIRH
jgi:cadmium resistance protein CadD (predicted permease)